MTIYILLTTPSTDAGPFNLYSNVDYSTPLAINVSKSTLLAGYPLIVPNGTTIIRAVSVGELCTNYLEFVVKDCVYVASVNDVVQAVYVQPDDKILVGGNFTQVDGVSRVRLARLNTNGSLDTSFTVGTGFNNSVYNIALQSDGKILVTGIYTNYNGSTAQPRLTRLNSDGSIDITFNSGGSGIVGASFTYADGLAVQPDGKILVGGNFVSYNGSFNVSRFMRINSNGSLETSISATVSDLYNIVVGSDNKIYATGSSFITKRNSDTTADATFGGGRQSMVQYGYGLAVQPDGKIIVGGWFGTYKGLPVPRSLIRLNSDSTIDATFDVGVSGLSDISGREDVRAVVLQPDGKIIVGGTFTQYRSQSVYNIMRLNSDGSIDNTFDVGTGFNKIGTFSVYDVKLQSSGRIVVGGSFTEYNGQEALRVAILNPDGSLYNCPPTSSTTTTTSTTISPFADYWYYGKKNVPGGVVQIPTSLDIDISLGTVVTNVNPAGTIVASFNSATDDFLWFAIPVSATGKTNWFVSSLNQGLIGGPVSPFGNLFPDPVIVVYNTIPLYLYISTGRTNVTNMTMSGSIVVTTTSTSTSTSSSTTTTTTTQ